LAIKPWCWSTGAGLLVLVLVTGTGAGYWCWFTGAGAETMDGLDNQNKTSIRTSDSI
jgi:hypothetical protein